MTSGFGPMLSFDVGAGAAAEAVVDASCAWSGTRRAWAAVDSLACLPAHTSHIQLGPKGRAEAGIPEGLVRLSVGIEDVDDLWADLEQALAKAASVEREPARPC